jgi:acyl-CoA thioesterase-1
MAFVFIRSWTNLILSTLLTVLLAGLAASAEARPIHIVALGDSNTYGKGVKSSETYPAQLQTLLHQEGMDAIVENAGINGSTTFNMLQRLEKVVSAETRLVILQPGGNDFRYGNPEQRRINITKILRQLHDRGIPVVMMENYVLLAVPPGERAVDQMHFTPQGYATMARMILPRVQDALRRLPKRQQASLNP